MVLCTASSIKKYLFITIIGQGTYGRCHMAIERNTNRYVACKEITHTGISHEATIHANLKHSNVVQFIEEIPKDTTSYIIMEYCVYGTLSDLLRCRHNLTNPEVRCVSRQIVSGIKYLHNNMVIHRDLKLTNLLISSTFIIKICDFGLSTKVDQNKRRSVCGTYNYMAPEMVKGNYYSFPVDIWAFGCVVFTLLEGNEPFSDVTKIEPLHKSVAFSQTKHLSMLAWRFLQSTLQVDAKKRPTAHCVLDHGYFTTGLTLPQLNITSFYQKPNNIVSRKLKRAVLKDATNLPHVPQKSKNVHVGKENMKKLTMTLRPRIKLTSPPEEHHNAEIVMANGGKQMAYQLSLILRQWLLLQGGNDAKLFSSDKSFLFVKRWLAGGNTLGYHMSDGSMALDFGNKLIFYKKGQEEKFISPLPIPFDPLDRIVAKKLKGTVDYVERCLNQLAESGPMHVSSYPVVIVSSKFYHNVSEDTTQDPIASFLLSNGSCQMNFASHEKLIVNVLEDMIVSWNPREILIGRLSQLLRSGPPQHLKGKLEFMCYFAITVSSINN